MKKQNKTQTQQGQTVPVEVKQTSDKLTVTVPSAFDATWRGVLVTKGRKAKQQGAYYRRSRDLDLSVVNSKFAVADVDNWRELKKAASPGERKVANSLAQTVFNLQLAAGHNVTRVSQLKKQSGLTKTTFVLESPKTPNIELDPAMAKAIAERAKSVLSPEQLAALGQ